MDEWADVYQLAYPVPPKDPQHALFLHQVRDCAGFAYLREAFLVAGIPVRLGGIIRNVTGGERPPLGPAAVVCATTRFPLDDEKEWTTRNIRRSNSPLEQEIFAVARGFFTRLHRRQAILSPALVQRFPKASAHLANALFNTHRGARCLSYVSPDGQVLAHQGEPKTLAYFLNLPGALSCGAGLVWSFGMGGEQGLLWNRLVMRKFADFLTVPTFAVIEFDALESYEEELGPTTLDGVEVHERIVLKIPADEIARAAQAARLGS